MKKILLSAVVLISFFSYAMYIKVKGINQAPVITQATIGNTQRISPTATSVPPTAMPTTPVKQTTVPQSVPPTATLAPVIPTATPKPASGYKDGTFVGSAADAIYGNIQVQATISNGQLTNVQFLQYPNDRGTSIEINQQADPLLAQEAIQSQSANVNIISGATDSSQAFVQSLQSALDKAKS